MDKKPSDNANISLLKGSSVRDDQWSALVVAVGKHRDRKSFAKLFKHFAPLIKSFAQASRQEGWFPGIAEDLVQEVMIKVWQKADAYDPKKASATTWIYTVTRNSRIDMLRRKSNIQHLPIKNEDLWHELDKDTPISFFSQKRTEEQVKESLCRLPREQNEIIRKVYLEGKSHVETSNELNIPLGTVKSRVRLGLQKLQLLVSTECKEDLNND